MTKMQERGSNGNVYSERPLSERRNTFGVNPSAGIKMAQRFIAND